MALQDIPPFAKVGGIVVGLALFGAIFWCSRSPSTFDHAACDSLSMDLINPCLAKVRKDCHGDDDAKRDCAEKIASELKEQRM